MKPVWPLLHNMLWAKLSSTEPAWQRLAIAAWATMVAATPQSWSRFLIGFRYEPMRRPQSLQRVAERIGRCRRTRGMVPSAG